VGTPDTGDEADRRGRQQSVTDLRSTLGKRHEHLVLVESAVDADIVVAIVERVVADSGSSLSLLPPRYYASRNIVRLRSTVTRDGESVDLAGARWREDTAAGWRFAAQDLAVTIDAWIAQTSGPAGKMLARSPDWCALAYRIPAGAP